MTSVFVGLLADLFVEPRVHDSFLSAFCTLVCNEYWVFKMKHEPLYFDAFLFMLKCPFLLVSS